MSSESVYNCIKAFRQKAGVTQGDLADAIGVSRQTIVAIEGGNYVPSVMLALRLSVYFKVGVEDLFSLTKNSFAH